jgi:ATP-binding cassette subfamily B multidrug efflux pump
MLGRVVDWLSHVEPSRLWVSERGSLLLLAGILLASPLLIALQTMFKHQTLAGNFPMRLRWNFHRHMLSQSMSFYQDEFAGRVAAKVMQTALAVRDTVLIVTDILVFVVIYFVTMVAVVGSFDVWLLAPFIGWLALYVAALYYFVPRLGKVATAQADARSLMTGRITDAYTNIATVKLFSHAQREAGFARSAMQDFMKTTHAQMRLVSGFEIVNHILSMLLIAGTAGATLWLWTGGKVGVGAVAAATDGAAPQRHLALDHVGDGVAVRAHRHRAGRHQHLVTPSDGDRRRRRRATHRQPRRDPLRAGELRLRRRAAGDRRAVAADPPGREDRPGRAFRRG